MNRLSGLDLARGFAFMGMVIVNYRVTLSWVGEPDWLQDLMDKFTSRAAPLFVLIAGVGVTLLFRSGMRRKAEGGRAPLGAHLLRAAVLGMTLAALALIVDYNRWTSVEKKGTASPATIINGWIEDDTKVTEELPARIDTYTTALQAGDTDRALLHWMLAGAAVCVVVGLILRRDPRGALVTRAGFLLAFGYAWYPVWVGDILHWYGVFLIVGAVLVAARWWLMVPALLVTLAARPYLRVFEGWNASSGMGPGTGPFWEMEGQARNLFYNGWHPVSPWLGLLLVGLIIGRLPLGTAKAAIAIGLTGLMLWWGTEEGGTSLRQLCQDAARDQDAEVCERVAAEHPDGHRLVLGPASKQSAEEEGSEDFFSRRTSAPRIQVKTAEGLEPGTKLQRAARGIARGLRRSQRQVGFTDWGLRIEPAQAADAAPDILIDVSYGDGTEAPADHERHRAHVVSALAGLMRREKASTMNMWSGLGRWPANVPRVGVRRTLTMEDGETGERRSIPYDTTWVETATVRGVDQKLARMATELGKSGPGPLWFLSALGTSLMVLGLCLFIARWAFVCKVLHPVICAGQMALTLYVFHVFIGLTAIESIVSKRALSGDLAAVATCIVVCWLISLGFAHWWRSFAKRGPLEMLMRAICG